MVTEDRPNLQELIGELVVEAKEGKVLVTVTPCKMCGEKSFKIIDDSLFVAAKMKNMALSKSSGEVELVDGEVFVCGSCSRVMVILHDL